MKMSSFMCTSFDFLSVTPFIRCRFAADFKDARCYSACLAERKDAHDQTNTKQQLLLPVVLLIGFHLVFMCETNLAAAAEINHILQQQFV